MHSVQHYHQLENLVDEWLASRKFADVEVHVSRLGGSDGEGTPSPVGTVMCVKVSDFGLAKKVLLDFLRRQ